MLAIFICLGNVPPLKDKSQVCVKASGNIHCYLFNNQYISDILIENLYTFIQKQYLGFQN